MEQPKKLSFSAYLTIGSMLFGLFFGAGNLIFPIHMGQEAGSHVVGANIGFLITAVGLPFLGILAIGFSNSSGLFDLSTRVNRWYAYFFTVTLYLTIGPFFALPRTATVSYEIGILPFIPKEYNQIGLFLFTLIFFLFAWFFSLRPGKIMVWIGKILNPLFLIFLGILIVTAFIHPMGSFKEIVPSESYQHHQLFTGMIEGYNTMDTLASLAFGIIVVQSINEFGVRKAKDVASNTLKSGFVTLILMGLIYSCLAFLGTMSRHQFDLSENGGIALSQVANYYFGSFGAILLALIIIFACLKTAIGLITACSETFQQLFPKISYKWYVHIFSLMGMGVANIGLNEIIRLSLPVLLFLHPLAIVLIVLTFLSPLFHNKKIVYQMAILFTFVVSLFDGLHEAPDVIKNFVLFDYPYRFFHSFLPFGEIQMDWILPAILGTAIGWMLSLNKSNRKELSM